MPWVMTGQGSTTRFHMHQHGNVLMRLEEVKPNKKDKQLRHLFLRGMAPDFPIAAICASWMLQTPLFTFWPLVATVVLMNCDQDHDWIVS